MCERIVCLLSIPAFRSIIASAPSATPNRNILHLTEEEDDKLFLSAVMFKLKRKNGCVCFLLKH